MSRRLRMLTIIFILLSITSFILLVKFYPPLNRYLFGGEFEISLDDIQFWVKKVPQRDYYRVYAKYVKSPKTAKWSDSSHPIFYADSNIVLGYNDIFFNPEDNKVYGGGSEKDTREWKWAFYCFGEGKIDGNVFKPFFPKGTKFTFHQLGSLEFPTPPGNCITIHLPGRLKKLEKEELEKPSIGEIVEGEDYTKRGR